MHSTAKPVQPIRLHRHYMSGHCHRVELLLAALDIPYEVVDIDFPGGEHKSPRFMKLNPLGQVPVIEDGDLVLYDSNAILVYLATRYDDGRWLPRDPVTAARVQQWLSMAAGQVANGPNSARLVKLFGAPLDYARAKTIAENLFAVLDVELSTRAYAVGEGQPSPILRCTATSPWHPTAKYRWSRIRICAPGCAASNSCRASFRCPN